MNLKISFVFHSRAVLLCVEGCADFVPSRLDAGGSHYTVPQFECFADVLRKAANWIQAQQRVRVTNVQSIDYKLKHEAGLSALPALCCIRTCTTQNLTGRLSRNDGFCG